MVGSGWVGRVAKRKWGWQVGGQFVIRQDGDGGGKISLGLG